MKNIIIISFLLLVSAGCSVDTSEDIKKEDIIGDWIYYNVDDEIDFITFTKDSMFVANTSMVTPISYYHEVDNDTLKFSFKNHGGYMITTKYFVHSVSTNSIIVETLGVKTELKRTHNSIIKL